MTTTGIFPVPCTDDLAACRSLSCALLDLEVTFECSWYVALRHPADHGQQVAFVA